MKIPLYKELVIRASAGASEPYLICGFGAGDCVLGTILLSTCGGCETVPSGTSGDRPVIPILGVDHRLC